MGETIKLPKTGDHIPVERFHISEMNVRAGQPFGETEEDRNLIANLRREKIIGPFRARPEGEGYGVVVGRRRFLAKKEAGVDHLVAGADCLIEEMTDEEAREASLIENLEVLRRSMDPVTRANALADVIAYSPTGLRGTARRLGMPPSTLSEWLKVLKLTPKLQEAVKKGSMVFSDSLNLAKMKLSEERQDQLAEVLENEGYEAFQKAVERQSAGRLKRGIPKGVYEVDRVIWDKRSRKDVKIRETISRAAKARGFEKEPEYIKDYLVRHIEEIEGEAS